MALAGRDGEPADDGTGKLQCGQPGPGRSLVGLAAAPDGLLSPGKKAQVRRIPLGALQEREFRLYFTGQLVSLLGDAVTPFALAWAVLDLTGSTRDLGFVLAANTAPLVVFLLAGGVLADRLPRRGVMLAADVGRMAIQAATAALLLSHTARIWELVVLQALAGTGTAFFNPASTGLTPMTVSAERDRKSVV